MIGGLRQIRDRDRLAFGSGLAERAAGLVDDQMRALGGALDADRLASG